MIVHDFGGATSVDGIAQLETALSRRFAGDANEFWLSHVSGCFPAMSIMAKDNFAALYYFPKKDHPGFVSQGNFCRNESGFTAFSSGTVNEKIQIPDEVVVGMAVATDAAKQFLVNAHLPNCIDWFEL